MSQIRQRIEDDIIKARRASDTRTIEVLSYVKDRLQIAERELFKTMLQPTYEERLKKRKLLELKEEAAIVMNSIRGYEEEINGLKAMKVRNANWIKERQNKIDLLIVYLNELRRSPDQLDEIILDICITNDVKSRNDISKAMKVATEMLCYEDQSIIYSKIIDLIK